MTVKPLTTQRYEFYTTSLTPMSDAQIAKQHGMSLDELEDWKEKNSIQQQGVSIEEKKHSRTVSILDKDKPPLTLELYKSYKELAKPISDNAIGNEHGMNVGDMQKFKREHDLIGKYGKNTKDAVEKRAETVEKVTAAPEANKLPEIVRIKEKAPEPVEEPEEELKPQESITSQLAELTTLADNPDFTTFRNEYVPSDAQAAEMIRLRQELQTLRREQEWLENRHVQDTEIVANVNAVIKQQEADRQQWELMRGVVADLKDTRREHIKEHGYAPVPHQERMTRLMSTLGVVAGQEEQNDYVQYLNLIALASEVLSHAEQIRAGVEVSEV